MNNAAVPRPRQRGPRAPPAAVNAEAQARFANPGAPIPMLGMNQVVFPVGAGVPIIPEYFDIGFHKYSDAVALVIDEMVQEPSFDNVAFYADPGNTERWKEGYEGMLFDVSIGCLMQSIVAAHKTLEMTGGDTSAVSGPTLTCSSLLRSLAAQYGEFDQADLGIRIRFTDFMDVTRRLGRALQTSLDNKSQEEIICAYYFPVRKEDYSLEPVYMTGIRNILTRARGLSPTNQLWSEGRPAWLDFDIGEFLSQDDVDALYWVYGDRPELCSEYRTHHWHLIAMALGITIPETAYFFEFVGKNEFKDSFSELVRVHATYQRYDARWLLLADNLSFKDKVGSSSQAWTIERQYMHVRASGPLSTDAHALSMAAIFPCSGLLATTRPETVVQTVEISIDTLRRRWVSAGIKPLA